GVLLPDDVIVEHALDLLRAGNAFLGLDQRGFVLLADNVHAEFDAFIADEDRRPRDELAHLVLALSAERAVESVLRLSAGAAFAHKRSFQGRPDRTVIRENGGLMALAPVPS